MCLNQIKISNLETRIKVLEKEIAFEKSQTVFLGESKKVGELQAKLDKLNEKLVELQSTTDVPSSNS